MKAFMINRYGKKNDLQLTEMPDPVLQENDVLVQIHAAGVNLVDSKIRDGEFKLILPYKLPLILGNDVAGVVTHTTYNSSQLATINNLQHDFPTFNLQS